MPIKRLITYLHLDDIKIDIVWWVRKKYFSGNSSLLDKAKLIVYTYQKIIYRAPIRFYLWIFYVNLYNSHSLSDFDIWLSG